MNEPKIVWEKWQSPLRSIDGSIQPSTEEDENYEIEPESFNENRKINAIITPVGLIPMNEHTDCDKIFNFWTGHSNFNLTSNIAKIIESVEGVETLDIFTRYRFRVSIGKAFVDRNVMNTITSEIINYIQ